MLLIAAASAAPAVPVFGLEWRPLGRADLAWVQEGRTTGLGVGELDGSVRPPLSAWFGLWASQRVAFVGSLGVARLTTTTWTQGADGEDVYVSRHWGVVRPELGLRLAPWGHDRSPMPLAQLGVHGDIPSARAVSNAYTEAEQLTADEIAAADRARLGGFGARLGLGAEVALGRGVRVGGIWSLAWQQTLTLSDDTNAVSTWLVADASLLFSIELPARQAATPEP